VSEKLFGTDGVRGVANADLTPELAFQLGQAAGQVLLRQGGTPRVVVGRDTRRSGPMLGAALASGFCSVGVDVDVVGVAPTPAVSFFARTGDYGLGGIVSASHNPAPDNGIKFVGHDGFKTTEEFEAEVEGLLGSPLPARPQGKGVGSLSTGDGETESYVDYLVGLVPERLEGMRVAVDAANGAAYRLAGDVLRRLGAEPIETGVSPDGLNINADGGATKPATIQSFTQQTGAELGVAFDGDADRAVFSDASGRLVNGDCTIGIWCAYWQRQGKLNPPVAVGTVMTNGGFEQYLRRLGIGLERTPVGDKYVSDRIQETRALVGGEQSGHIIFREFGPTGDGLITMLQILRIVRRDGRKLAELVDEYEPWPQLLVNLSVERREGWNEGEKVAKALADAERELTGRGRLVVRPSGTQPMIRVMVEADSYPLRDAVAEAIIGAMHAELGGEVYSRVDLTHALGD